VHGGRSVGGCGLVAAPRHFVVSDLVRTHGQVVVQLVADLTGVRVHVSISGVRVGGERVRVEGCVHVGLHILLGVHGHVFVQLFRQLGVLFEALIQVVIALLVVLLVGDAQVVGIIGIRSIPFFLFLFFFLFLIFFLFLFSLHFKGILLCNGGIIGRND